MVYRSQRDDGCKQHKTGCLTRCNNTQLDTFRSKPAGPFAGIFRSVRWSADANPDTDSYSNSYTDSHPNPHPNPNSHTNAGCS